MYKLAFFVHEHQHCICKFQARPAMQQTIPAETAEDSRVAERFNYDQSTVLVWIYTAVLLQWTRPDVSQLLPDTEASIGELYILV